MKRKILVFSFCLLAVLAFYAQGAEANKGNKVYTLGFVESIDLAQQTFVVKQRDNSLVTIYVLPSTEIEVEYKSAMKLDRDVELKELKVGDWVKIESYLLGEMLQADEVEINR